MKAFRIICGILILCALVSACKRPPFDKNKYGNCSDGIKNQNEEDIDCGGYCMPCANCDNGVQDGSETGIDCGGAACISCMPGCSLSSGSASYTLYPSGFTGSVSGTSQSGSGYYSAAMNEISVSLSNGAVNGVIFELFPGFNPMTHIPLNQTMVFKATTGFNINYKHHTEVRYSGNFGFSGFYGKLDDGELIYMTKISSNTLRIQICNAGAGNESLSLNVACI